MIAWRPMRGLLAKEALQILRDPSALMIAFLLPIILLVVDGFGISLDARRMPLAVLAETPAELTRGIVQALANSPYLHVVGVSSTEEGVARMTAGEVRGMLVLREDFAQRLASSSRWPAPVQLVVNATDPNTAAILEGYVEGAMAVWLGGQARELGRSVGGVSVEPRYWFNPALRSADFIVPGVIAFVMAMTGTLLTALIVAREWERGTMEAMLASPARLGAMILAKLGSYFVLGMLAMLVSVAIAILVFGVPFRGSVGVLLLASALFLVFSLALGLFISTLTRNQFVAAQLAFLLTMMPCMMLSGMIFDIASMPDWLQIVTTIVPARYLVTILQSLFLAGTVWPLMLPDLAALAIAAAVSVAAVFAVTRRRLD